MLVSMTELKINLWFTGAARLLSFKWLLNSKHKLEQTKATALLVSRFTLSFLFTPSSGVM